MKNYKSSIFAILLAGGLALSLFAQPYCANAEQSLQAQASGFSYHVLFTGAFYEPDRAPEGARRAYTLEVIVDGEKKWIFVVDKAVSLGRAATELKIVQSIFPPQLSFRGNKKALDYLLNPDIAGKTLTVQGHLYSKERWFQVLRVEPVIEDKGEEEH